MAKESVVLEVPEKQQDDLTYAEAVKYMVEQRKAEFQVIQGKLTQYKTQLMDLEERKARSEAELKSLLVADRQKFDREKAASLADISSRYNILQTAERLFVERLVNLEHREAQAEKIHEERRRLFDEKLKYEQLNSQAQAKLNEAEKICGEAAQEKDDASLKKVAAETAFKEIKNVESIIDKKREDLSLQEEDVQRQIGNLETLRKDITPKIEELKGLIVKNENVLADIVKKEQEAADRVNEDNQLLDLLAEKEKRLKDREIVLVIQEKELFRKKILLDKYADDKSLQS